MAIDPGRCGAVVLAAGLSSRMGSIDKLSLQIDGQPLLRRTLKTVREAGIGEVVVVLGHRREQRAQLANIDGVQSVYHADYEQGQQSSVVAGLRALSAGCDPVLVVLGDLPLLEASDIVALLDAFGSRRPGIKVLVPRWQNGRGNPVVVERAVVDAVIELDDPGQGLRGYIDSHREIVASFGAQNDHYVFDLDTPADIARLETRLGRPVEGWDRNTD